MTIPDIDVVQLAKLISHQVEHVTCIECCVFYKAPKTAACGHSLCQTCWIGRTSCPVCAKSLDRKTLKLNNYIQSFTEHIKKLSEEFKKLFNVKLDEFLLDVRKPHQHLDKNESKNVKEWLESSQNHFSAPISTEPPFQDQNTYQIFKGNVQVHSDGEKINHLNKLIHVQSPQDDWDKIELMSDKEEIVKNKENVAVLSYKEPFFLDDNEYTTENPRRSSRKKDKLNNKTHTNNMPNEHIAKNTSSDADNILSKSKQNWNNVKKMSKEFSKLSKNKNKLNVSIEMCKNNQNTVDSTLDYDHTSINNVQKSNARTCDILPNILTGNSKKQSNSKDNNLYINNKNAPNILCSESANPSINDGNNLMLNYTNKNTYPNCDMVPNALIVKNKNQLDGLTDNQTINNDINVSNMQCYRKKTSEIVQIDQTRKMSKKSVIKQKSTNFPFFKKGALCIEHKKEFSTAINHKMITNSDDLEISVKVGQTITKIVIEKKNNDVQLRVHSEKDVQTSLGSYNIQRQGDAPSNINVEVKDSQENRIINTEKLGNKFNSGSNAKSKSNNSESVKKNTSSADTVPAQFEITESEEKELSDVMNRVENDNPQINNVQQSTEVVINTRKLTHDIIRMNDIDIFSNSQYMKESEVQTLKKSNHTPSEILVSTVTSRKKATQRQPNKRSSTEMHIDMPLSKRPRVINDTPVSSKNLKHSQDQSTHVDIEIYNLDENVQNEFTNTDIIDKMQSQKNIETNHNSNINVQNCSENIFSDVGKDTCKLDQRPVNESVQNLLTPGVCIDILASQQMQSTPILVDVDDSDKSVVEETPQKDVSVTKIKRKHERSNTILHDTERINSENSVKKLDKSSDRGCVKSAMNLIDSSKTNKSCNDITVIETSVTKKQALETPLTINKFTSNIQHKSTPVARKSLNFDPENVEDTDPERTICPISQVVAKTTQEKEFMRKAFEKTQSSPGIKNLMSKKKQLRLAGSCLTLAELTKVKLLCSERGWTFSEKFTKDVTHLVVGVDEENRSQRSVKYMCALAASKWIVSFEWVKKCIQMKDTVDEEHYEVLDSTGEPGPRRSRIAKQKLFNGITFFCMPPFSVLDIDILKNMLEAAGGCVLNDVQGVRVTDNTKSPTLLLAEPENTQEDNFMCLAINLKVVPVNYEWVLNCLGNYTLGSIQELLLCPPTLLPPATARWPSELIAD